LTVKNFSFYSNCSVECIITMFHLSNKAGLSLDKICVWAESNVRPWKKCERGNRSKDQWAPEQEREELVPTNTGRPQGATSDANQEATWCERGQINATELTVTRDRCFLNDTHHTLAHMRLTKAHMHLHTILGLLLISSLRCVRGFPRHPAHAHAHMHPQTGGVGVGRTSRPRRTEDRARTQTRLTTGRKV